MKLRSAFLGAACLLSASLPSFAAVHAAPGSGNAGNSSPDEVLWAVRISPNQFTSGLAGELLKSLGAALPANPGLGKLDQPGIVSLDITGYGGPEFDEGTQFLAEINLDASKKQMADMIFDSLTKQYGGTAEEIAGQKVIHYTISGVKGHKAGPQDFWITRPSDTRFLLSPAKAILEAALKRDPSAPGALGPRRDSELVGGMVELDRLPVEEIHDSELLAMVRQLSFHIDSTTDALHLAVDAAVGDSKKAKRVARMIEGMITAMSLNEPDSKGDSLDDRLKITANNDALEVEITLNAKESKELVDAFTKGIQGANKKSPTLQIP